MSYIFTSLVTGTTLNMSRCHCCYFCCCREVLDFVKKESLAVQWNRDKANGTTTNVTRVISQATAYAAAYGINFFAISTYQVTWFAKVVKPGTIAITKGFSSDDSHPSVMQVGIYMWMWMLVCLQPKQAFCQDWNRLSISKAISLTYRLCGS